MLGEAGPIWELQAWGGLGEKKSPFGQIPGVGHLRSGGWGEVTMGAGDDGGRAGP